MLPLLIAHKGDAIHFPENTIEAFQSAFDNGADGIELDTQLDDSGNIIIVHNYEFDRSKNYPLLKDVLEMFGNKGRIEIELKLPDKESVTKVNEVIQQCNISDYELASSIMPLLPLVKELLPNAKIGLIFKTKLLEDWMSEDYKNKLYTNYMELTKANVLHLPIKLYNEENVKLLKSKHYLLHADLGKNHDEYAKAVKLGIDQCTIDDVREIKRLKDSLT